MSYMLDRNLQMPLPGCLSEQHFVFCQNPAHNMFSHNNEFAD